MTTTRTIPVAEQAAGPDAGVATVTVRFFAAAKARVGRAEETWTVPCGATIGEALTAAGLAGDPVFARSSFLLDGRACDAGQTLSDGARIDVLPPFAGG